MNYEVLVGSIFVCGRGAGVLAQVQYWYPGGGFSLIIGKIGGMSNSQILGGFDQGNSLSRWWALRSCSASPRATGSAGTDRQAGGGTGWKPHLSGAGDLFLVTGPFCRPSAPEIFPVGALMTVVAGHHRSGNGGESPAVRPGGQGCGQRLHHHAPCACGRLTMSLSETAGYTDIISVMLNVMLMGIMMIGFSIHYKILLVKPGARSCGRCDQRQAGYPGSVDYHYWHVRHGIPVKCSRRLDVGLTSF